MKQTDLELLPYTVGPLLYSPAGNPSVAASILEQKFGDGYSLALCLEDTISDNHVAQAESILKDTLQTLSSARQIDEKSIYFPKIFIRVRNPEQIPHLADFLGEAFALVTGLILPKFSIQNADAYIQQMHLLNRQSKRKIYMMPILEDRGLLHLLRRPNMLYALKEKLDACRSLVLNVRVGGNDLCNCLGLRRNTSQTIYDIRTVSGLLIDILTVFGEEYVVSGPVWEYYQGKGWDSGLERELALDRLNGFIGKTVIHPNQIPLVRRAYQVSREDYEDALAILGWEDDRMLLVSGNTASRRMNEQKVHTTWARRILALKGTYGLID